MRAVTGVIRSSKTLSLSHAARLLRQFAEADTSAPSETAVFVRRASASFDELVEFESNLNLAHQEGEVEDGDLERGTGDIKEKKRKRENAEERSDLLVKTERNLGLDEKNDQEIGSERKKKKRKKEESEKDDKIEKKHKKKKKDLEKDS